MDDIAFGRLVKLARINRGWRQQDLAERLLSACQVALIARHGRVIVS